MKNKEKQVLANWIKSENILSKVEKKIIFSSGYFLTFILIFNCGMESEYNPLFQPKFEIF